MQQLNRWYNSKRGLFLSLLIEAGAIYGLASLAIARGNLWYYVAVIFLMVAFLQNSLRLIGKLIHGLSPTKA